MSGVIALDLAILCFLGVLAFHFPEYLTTPELRKSYNVDAMRLLLFWSLVLSGALALLNIVMGRARWLALAAFVLIAASLALGGHKVRSTISPTTRPTSASTGSSSTCSARP